MCASTRSLTPSQTWGLGGTEYSSAELSVGLETLIFLARKRLESPVRHWLPLGYVSVKKADYHGALQRAVEVRPLIHETYGGLHRTASRTLREMAGVHAARHSGSAGGRRASTSILGMIRMS